MPQKKYTANFGIQFMLEAYFDILLSLYLVENMLENVSVSVEIRIVNVVF